MAPGQIMLVLPYSFNNIRKNTFFLLLSVYILVTRRLMILKIRI